MMGEKLEECWANMELIGCIVEGGALIYGNIIVGI